MIQVQEVGGLDHGQKLDAEIAKQLGLKVFRTTTKSSNIHDSRLESVSRLVKAWYDSGCRNMALEAVEI